MIFVTVGTHEQSFDRLIKKIDNMIRDDFFSEPVYMQIGYSTYIPKYAKYVRFLEYKEMEKFIDTARIVITHGGPSSFINVLSKGKNPIVVPRLSRFDEHVNDHQLTFVRELQKRRFNIIVVEDMQLLEEAIVNFTDTSNTFNSNNDAFVEKFSHIVYGLF